MSLSIVVRVASCLLILVSLSTDVLGQTPDISQLQQLFNQAVAGHRPEGSSSGNTGVGQIPGNNLGGSGQFPGNNFGGSGQFPGNNVGGSGQFPGNNLGGSGQLPGSNIGNNGGFGNGFSGTIPNQFTGTVGGGFGTGNRQPGNSGFIGSGFGQTGGRPVRPNRPNLPNRPVRPVTSGIVNRPIQQGSGGSTGQSGNCKFYCKNQFTGRYQPCC